MIGRELVCPTGNLDAGESGLDHAAGSRGESRRSPQVIEKWTVAGSKAKRVARGEVGQEAVRFLC